MWLVQCIFHRVLVSGSNLGSCVGGWLGWTSALGLHTIGLWDQQWIPMWRTLILCQALSFQSFTFLWPFFPSSLCPMQEERDASPAKHPDESASVQQRLISAMEEVGRGWEVWIQMNILIFRSSGFVIPLSNLIRGHCKRESWILGCWTLQCWWNHSATLCKGQLFFGSCCAKFETHLLKITLLRVVIHWAPGRSCWTFGLSLK